MLKQTFSLNETARWIAAIAIINILHMSEQMMFGIGELATLKQILAGYYGWFRQPDYATVVLVTFASTLLFSLVLAVLADGVGRPIACGFVGLLAVSEIHHLIETVYAGHYTPGTVTAIPYVAAGVMLFRTLRAEHRKAAAEIGSSLRDVVTR
jgi:hypothetical protein